jgi:hypothetical protein
MDASATSRVLPPSDVFAPRIAARNDSDSTILPPEQIVSQVKDTNPSANVLNSRKDTPSEENTEPSQDEPRRGYVFSSDNLFVYRETDKTTGYVLSQTPSEQSVKLRAYIAQQQAAQIRRKELETQPHQSAQEHQNVLA